MLSEGFNIREKFRSFCNVLEWGSSVCLGVCTQVNSSCEDLGSLISSDGSIGTEVAILVPIDPSVFHRKGNVFSVPDIRINIRKSTLVPEIGVPTRERAYQHLGILRTSDGAVGFKRRIIESYSPSFVFGIGLSEVLLIKLKSTEHDESTDVIKEYCVCRDICGSDLIRIKYFYNLGTHVVRDSMFQDKYLLS